MWQNELNITTSGQGLYLISSEINQAISSSKKNSSMLNIFIRHTSASLLIQENTDPTAKMDLEGFFNRLAPENQSWHRHTLEGPDDTTSHLKSALTQTSINIPIIEGKLGTGTWQGVYLFEHRRAKHNRKIVLTLY